MSNLGSFLENPQINHEMCRVTSEFFGDCLRTKAGLPRKSSTVHPNVLPIYNSATLTNTFTEEQIHKFEERLMILLIRMIPYERKIIKDFDLPNIFIEAADFEGFKLDRNHLPNHFQININGNTISLLPLGERVEQTYNLLYDGTLKDWI